MKVYCNNCKHQFIEDWLFNDTKKCRISQYSYSDGNQPLYEYQRCNYRNQINKCVDFEPSIWFKIKNFFCRKRRIEMANVKSFKEMTEEEKVSFLEGKKEISKRRHASVLTRNKEIKTKRKAFKALVQKGNEKLAIFEKDVEEGKIEEAGMWSFFPSPDVGFEGTVLVIPVDSDNNNIECRYSYCIKAPTDEHKIHIARGLCAIRSKTQSPWSGNVTIPRFIYEGDKTSVRTAVTNLIMSQIILCEKHIPMRLLRSIYKDKVKKLGNR